MTMQIANIYIKVGQNIAELRIKRGISQERLGLEAGMGRTYLGEIERGKKRASIAKLYNIACALNIPLRDLFTFV
jgi:transcriptional regulator with XRE-family HTH domain